jgi:DNA-binding NarL/FixJ family response regulator
MKVLLADDHRMMRDGLRVILEKRSIEVVGEAGDGREAVTLAERLRPDIVVMDIAMPELNGIDATRRLVASVPSSRIIGLSMNADRRYVLAMFAAGAMGYLLKSSAAEELVQAVREVFSGHKYVSPSIAGTVIDNIIGSVEGARPMPKRTPPGFPAMKALTAREREVLQLVAEGKTSKQIATSLEVGMATVETHRRQLMDKLGLRTIAELTKYAIREGLTSLD